MHIFLTKMSEHLKMPRYPPKVYYRCTPQENAIIPPKVYYRYTPQENALIRTHFYNSSINTGPNSFFLIF